MLYKLYKNGTYVPVEAGRSNVTVAPDGVWIIDDEVECSEDYLIVDGGDLLPFDIFKRMTTQ